MIHVAFITDNEYLLPTKIAVLSLIKNANRDTKGIIYIVCESVEYSREYMKEIETNNFQIEYILIDKRKVENVRAKHLYVSVVASNKFLLPDMLFGLDKVLYLDGDIIVRKDLSELFDIDLEDSYLAAVKDMGAVKCGCTDVRDINGDYFNSGVMLLNLAQLRKDGMPSKLIEDRVNDDDMRFMDQNSLNRVLGERVKYISLQYNYMKANLLEFEPDEIARFWAISRQEYDDISADPVILHLTNYLKPWKSRHAIGMDEWCKYLDGKDVLIVMDNYLHEQEKELEIKYREKLIQHINEYEFRIKQENESHMYLMRKYASTKNKSGKNRRYVIYGAGVNAINIFKKCHEANKEDSIEAFAVTNKCGNADYLFGIPVVMIDELVEDKNRLVIIVSVRESSRKEVLTRLAELEFRNVVVDGMQFEWNNIEE